MGTYVYLQDHRSLLEWYVTDFWFMQYYFYILIVGGLALLCLYIDSFDDIDKRLFNFQPNMKCVLVTGMLVASILFWIYYPFPVTTASNGDWTSSKLFPQNYYNGVYIENNLLHLVSVLVKAMFAYTQFYLLSRFRRL